MVALILDSGAPIELLNFGVMWVMDQCIETRGGTPASQLVGSDHHACRRILGGLQATPKWWGAFVSAILLQVVYKKAGLKGLKLDLCNAESTTDS
jgi:hypothetical protein